MEPGITLENIEARLSVLKDHETTGEMSPSLTEKQRLYAVGLLKHGPEKWRLAAKEAGYAEGTGRTVIESGEAFLNYLAALKREISLRLALTPASVNFDLQRLSKKAEDAGEYGAAIRAKKLQGDMVGAFDKSDSSGIQFNAEGIAITITNARSQEDDEAIDAVWRDVDELNQKGRQRPGPASLPPGAGEAAQEVEND